MKSTLRGCRWCHGWFEPEEAEQAICSCCRFADQAQSWWMLALGAGLGAVVFVLGWVMTR